MKKSTKVLVSVAAFVFVISCIIVYANRKPSRPVTNLEFWIADNVDEVDFSGFQEKFGLFGGREYYGTGYVPAIDEDGMTIDPERCVIYTVTSFPDYSSNKQHITHITITDPAVEFYGISLNSSFQEFESLIRKYGFKITDSGARFRTAERGKYSVTFTDEYIRIRVEVSNIFGFQF